jgi:subtilisin family serine protease
MSNSVPDHNAVPTASHHWKRLVARSAVRIFLALTFLTASQPWSPLGANMALADDDDDYDDDYDDDDDDDGKARTVKQRKRQFVPAVPVRARFEIVALGLDEQGLLRLIQRGYRVIAEDDVSIGGGGKIRRLRVPAQTTIEQARAEVAGQSTTVIADLNYYYRPQGQFACEGPVCESFAMVDWQNVDPSNCGRAPTIGMVDTRIDTSHESLKNSNIEAITLRAEELRESGTQHGTAVAALLTGLPQSRVPGLLPNAKIVAVDPYHRGKELDDRTDAYELVRAIDLLVQRRPDAINLSLSGPDNSLLASVINEAFRVNVAVIAAAGNNGPKSKPIYPAAYENVIAVTALDKKYAAYRRAGRGPHIDFSAPGVEILTAAPDQRVQRKSGTSYAVPFVTAAVALAKVNAPNISHTELVQQLSANSRDLGDKGYDQVFGWGLIQAKGLCKSP